MKHRNNGSNPSKYVESSLIFNISSLQAVWMALKGRHSSVFFSVVCFWFVQESTEHLFFLFFAMESFLYRYIHTILLEMWLLDIYVCKMNPPLLYSILWNYKVNVLFWCFGSIRAMLSINGIIEVTWNWSIETLAPRPSGKAETAVRFLALLQHSAFQTLLLLLKTLGKISGFLINLLILLPPRIDAIKKC